MAACVLADTVQRLSQDDAPTSLPGSPREVSLFLKDAFAHQRGVRKWLTRLRPYICPFEELLRRIPRHRQISVLDAGCGVGIMSALVAGTVGARRVVGFDIDERPIAVARGLQLPGTPNISFHTLPAGQFPEGQYDVVVCIDVLHHVARVAHHDFVRSLCNSVAPGGMLLFKDISPRPWWKALANRMHDLVTTRHWVHYRHEDVVCQWLGETPGHVEESTRVDRLWYSHYLIVWRKAGNAGRSGV
jgi:2-polyprenyl-3-methyl-5-hydroxy-6-metoxy-1,4-benzoquinol methylase